MCFERDNYSKKWGLLLRRDQEEKGLPPSPVRISARQEVKKSCVGCLKAFQLIISQHRLICFILSTKSRKWCPK